MSDETKFATSVLAAAGLALMVVWMVLTFMDETADPKPDRSPKPDCFEDEAIVVAPQIEGQTEDLRWVCVAIDDFADEDSQNRLRAILVHR